MSRLARALLLIVVGLAIAFGVYYVAAWPSTINGAPAGGNVVGFGDRAPGEILHFGVLVRVVGERNVKLGSTRLIDPSPGLELVSVRLDREGVGVGALTGSQPRIEALPSASGAVLDGGSTASLVVTMRATSIGTYSTRGLVVRYTAGWLTRSASLGPKATVGVVEGPTPVATR